MGFFWNVQVAHLEGNIIMNKRIIGVSLLLSSFLFASNTTTKNSDETLLKKIEKAGMKSIPKSKIEINKLIDPKGILNDAKIELGKQLYFEPRLSKSGIISCNTHIIPAQI